MGVARSLSSLLLSFSRHRIARFQIANRDKLKRPPVYDCSCSHSRPNAFWLFNKLSKSGIFSYRVIKPSKYQVALFIWLFGQ